MVPSAIVLDDPPQAPKRRSMPPQNSRDIPAVLGPFFGAPPVVADRCGDGQQVGTRLVDDRLSYLQAQSFDEGVGGQAVFGELIRPRHVAPQAISGQSLVHGRQRAPKVRHSWRLVDRDSFQSLMDGGGQLEQAAENAW